MVKSTKITISIPTLCLAAASRRLSGSLDSPSAIHEERTDMTNAVQPVSEASNRTGARRLWIWPIAILISFPIGGYLADLVVDGVDSVGAAMIGGLIAGLVIGAAEWFVLRRWVSWLWILATSI